MKETENKWIDDTMESLQGIRRASASSDLFDRAMQRSMRIKARVVNMSAAQVWSAAACVVVLLVANLFMCLDYSHLGKKQRTDKEMFINEYFTSSEGPQI
ncbi:MAG TPA: hypothetical protein DCF33_19965 [Saprospirales bacterium]|nr:hypothetical protein [Saprospirales bacterium]